MLLFLVLCSGASAAARTASNFSMDENGSGGGVGARLLEPGITGLSLFFIFGSEVSAAERIASNLAMDENGSGGVGACLGSDLGTKDLGGSLLRRRFVSKPGPTAWGRGDFWPRPYGSIACEGEDAFSLLRFLYSDPSWFVCLLVATW